MQDDEDTTRLDDVLALGHGEHLLVRSLRRIVLRRAVCQVVAREFSDACGEDAAEVLATFRVFIEMLAYAARRRLNIGFPGCLGLTADERQILSLVAAAQDHDPSRFEALLCWVARFEARHQLAIAVRAVAAAFAAHNLEVSSAAPAVAARKADQVRPRLVS